MRKIKTFALSTFLWGVCIFPTQSNANLDYETIDLGRDSSYWTGGSLVYDGVTVKNNSSSMYMYPIFMTYDANWLAYGSKNESGGSGEMLFVFDEPVVKSKIQYSVPDSEEVKYSVDVAERKFGTSKTFQLEVDYSVRSTADEEIAPIPELMVHSLKYLPTAPGRIDIPETNKKPIIGVLGETAVGVKIESTDGRIIYDAKPGQPIYQDDIIETSTTGSTTITFTDKTTFEILEDARLTVDEYVFDPNAADASKPFLRRLFEVTGSLIGDNDEPDSKREVPRDSLGVRGDAKEIMEKFNDIATIKTGSPESLYTFVEVPDSSFEFSFDYGFGSEDTSLEVYLGGYRIGSFDSESDEINEWTNASFTISEQLLLDLTYTDLVFVADGATGSEVYIDNVVFPNLLNGDFEIYSANWFERGAGSVMFDSLATPDQVVAFLNAVDQPSDPSAPVPEPATMLLFATGLVGLAGVSRRRKN